MDSKDFQLLVALHENARQSYRALGRRVSLSAPAARDRLRNLESRGVIQGYWTYVIPSAFDRDDLLVFFKGEWTREDALKALAAPDVAFVAWKLDGGLTVQVWPRDRKQPIKDLTLVLRARPSGQAFAERRNHRPLTTLDWRIVDALIDDPRIPLKDLTESTGLSPKTVRKHLELMVEGETIFIMPRLGALSDSGELAYTMAVFGRVGMGELRKIMGDVFLIGETSDPPARYLLCRGSDLGDVTTKTRVLGKLPGVDSVTVTLNRELLVATEFVHSLVRERIQDLEKARR